MEREDIQTTSKDFSGQSLVNADFSGVHLEGANFRYADLRGANFNVAFLNGADFAFANLTGVILGELRSVNCLAFSPDGTCLATGGGDGAVKIWEVATGREFRTLNVRGASIYSVAFSPDGTTVAAGSWDDTVKVWEVSTGRNIRELRGHKGDVNGIAFHPGGALLASVSDDKTVKVWKLTSGEAALTFSGHKEWVKAVSFSPDGRWLASGGNDGSVKVWEVKTGREVCTLKVPKKKDVGSKISSLAFSPDGRYLAAGYEWRQPIALWETTAEWKCTYLNPTDSVEQLSFSPEGRFLLVAGWRSLQWWDLQMSSVVRTLEGTGAPFSMTTDGRLLASSSDRDRVKIVEVASGREVHTIRQELYCVRANIFRATGLREDQRVLMLQRGAVEVDPAELERAEETLGPFVRRQRLQTLVNDLRVSRRKERMPTVLLIGPGTFLPPLEFIAHEDASLWRRFRALFPFARGVSAVEWNEYFDLFYNRLMDREWYSFVEDERRKEPQAAAHCMELLRENYNALIRLVNEGVFPIVIDLDIFSELNREMFGPDMFQESYKDIEDLGFSLRRLGRELGYLEKGRRLYLKVFSEEGLFGRPYALGAKEPLEIFSPRLFEELFFSLFHRFGPSSVVWTGFQPYHSTRGIPFDRFGRIEHFYWVVDESLRESPEFKDVESTFLDYPIGQFSAVFRDLYQALGFEEVGLRAEAPISLFQLESLCESDDANKRAEAARKLVARAASPLASRAELGRQTVLLRRLQRDNSIEVRQTLLREFLKRDEQLPPELTGLIPTFAEDREDALRADVATWIIGQYERVGREYEPILMMLARDRSQYVRTTIVDTIKRRFEQLPSHIRQLASQLVGIGLAVEMVRGGGMLVDTPGELALRVINHGLETLPTVDVKILESAEYDVEGTNPTILTNLVPEVPQEVTFTVRTKVTHRVPLNYKVNGELREPPLYVNVIRDNPYVYGNPIDSSDAFFGRQRELDDIVQAVSKPNKQDILLVGERRTGKSSLLYQLETRLRPPFLPVYVVLNEAAARIDAVIAFLCGKVIRRLVEHGTLAAEPWNHHECSSLGLTDNLKTILDAAHQTAPDLKIVLLLDEADYILKVEDRLQNVMRAAFQSREVGDDVRVIVAGTTDLSTYVSQRSSPFFNHFRFVPLKPLGESETRDLITKPAGSLNYTYEPTAVDRIIRASGGHPYYCQRICYEAFALTVHAQQHLITLAYAKEAVQKVIQDADAYNGFVTGFWQPSLPRVLLTRPQKKFLAALANGKSTERFKGETVKRFLDWQIVVERDGHYEFTCELFREWTRRVSGK